MERINNQVAITTQEELAVIKAKEEAAQATIKERVKEALKYG